MGWTKQQFEQIVFNLKMAQNDYKDHCEQYPLDDDDRQWAEQTLQQESENERL